MIERFKSMQYGDKSYKYVNLSQIYQDYVELKKLPYSLKILLENAIRTQKNKEILSIVEPFVNWIKQGGTNSVALEYYPSRVLMQDFTGIPAVVDVTAMRDAVVAMGKDPQQINPLVPVHLVIDHSVMIDYYGTSSALHKNEEKEYERNGERYRMLKWAQQAFKNFHVVPPAMGICHQINIEYFSKVVWDKDDMLFPDTCIGTDSHTTMAAGIGVLAWGVGGIEAESVMLGQYISMLLPDVVGVHLSGRLQEGVTATDLVLTITELLRKVGVVGKFVEFYGPSLQFLKAWERSTISNMSPEYGATCGFFPVDNSILNYLRITGREESLVNRVETYTKDTGLFYNPHHHATYTQVVEFDLTTVSPSIAGPKRPQDRLSLHHVAASALALSGSDHRRHVAGDTTIANGDVVIAAITSCTNTSNPNVLIGAALLAKAAIHQGLSIPDWVKTSFAPGSTVVTQYLEHLELQSYLDQLGFQIDAYGCTTCIGNSGPLNSHIEEVILRKNLYVNAVLSGNRNFEGRVNPLTRGNYLMSPPLVVAYALAGTFNIDLTKDPIGHNKDGKAVYLKDIWPSQSAIDACMQQADFKHFFKENYKTIYEGDTLWKGIPIPDGINFSWNTQSSYIQSPPFYEPTHSLINNIIGARPLLILGNSITTDHISPAGNIPAQSVAGSYLTNLGVKTEDFNSYGSRRGNHHVMMRGTFANIRIKNEMLSSGKEGGYTIEYPKREEGTVFDVAQSYEKQHIPLIIIAGKEYGTGSSRDWAAKGPALLGVKAIIAESYERIHRSNLVGMGILPLVFPKGVTRSTLQLTGKETFDILGLGKGLHPKMQVTFVIHYENGDSKDISVLCRVDTETEVRYVQSNILQYVLKEITS